MILSYTSLKILRQIYCGPRGCSTQTWSQATCPFSFIARAIIDAFLWVSYKKYCGSVGSCLADSRNTPESGRTNKKIQYIFYYFVCFLCSSHSVVVCVRARGRVRACARARVRACVCVCVCDLVRLSRGNISGFYFFSSSQLMGSFWRFVTLLSSSV